MSGRRDELGDVRVTTRSRRFRERRRRGVIAVVPVEISRTDIWALRSAGLLRLEKVDNIDRLTLSNAVQELLKKWGQFRRSHIMRSRASTK
jgi:hypothetical protein